MRTRALSVKDQRERPLSFPQLFRKPLQELIEQTGLADATAADELRGALIKKSIGELPQQSRPPDERRDRPAAGRVVGVGTSIHRRSPSGCSLRRMIRRKSPY